MDKVKYEIIVDKIEWNTKPGKHSKKNKQKQIMRYTFQTMQEEERSYSNLKQALLHQYLKFSEEKDKEKSYQMYLTSYVIRSHIYLEDSGYMETLHFEIVGL